jgi:isopenicillin-N epimerase
MTPPMIPADRQPGAFSVHASAWGLDPAVTMLNHGSFGACPLAVLEAQQRLRTEMERQPVRFLTRQIQPLLDQSRQILCELIGADPAEVAFVSNVTTAVNCVLRGLPLGPGDELLLTDHGYNACRNVADYVAGRRGARVVVAGIPLPIESPQQVVDAVLARVTDRTRLAMLDHVTSPTAVVFPIAELVEELGRRGVDTLVDGAHAPGMLPLDLRRIGAAYYAGNCHKWLCTPKGAGFLHVRGDRREGLLPNVISHGYNVCTSGRSRFHELFDWVGTIDPTPWMCVGESIRYLGTLEPGGLAGLMRRNRELALWARRLLEERLGLRPVCPEAMLGAMAAVALPDDPPSAAGTEPQFPGANHRLHDELLDRFGIEAPVMYWPAAPHKLLRISAQAYNSPPQYERLVEALAGVL